LPSAESNLHSLSVFTPTAFEFAPESNVEATIRRKFRVSLLKLDESNLVTGIGNILCQEKLELAALSDRRKGWKLES
jgi:formamidopyrimidine-DNA glycosylase